MAGTYTTQTQHAQEGTFPGHESATDRTREGSDRSGTGTAPNLSDQLITAPVKGEQEQFHDPRAENAGDQLANAQMRSFDHPDQLELREAINTGFPPNDTYLRMLYEAQNPNKPLSDGQIVRPEDVQMGEPSLYENMTREEFLEAAQNKLPQRVLEELNYTEDTKETSLEHVKTLRELKRDLQEQVKDDQVLQMFREVETSIKSTLNSDELKIRDDKDFIDKTTIYMKALMKLAIISAIAFGTGGGAWTYVSAGASGMFTVYNDIYRKLKEDPQYREVNSHLGSMKEEIENMEKLYRSQVAELIKMYKEAPDNDKPNVLKRIKNELGQASERLLGNLENTRTAASKIPS